MGITLTDNDGYHGWRLTKRIRPDYEVQKYFPISRPYKFKRKKDYIAHKHAQLDLAKNEERKLTRERMKYKRTLPPAYLRSDGSVSGIIYKLEQQKRSKTPIFQISCVSKARDGKVFRTSVSILEHGLETAWDMAVSHLCIHKDISKYSKARKDIASRMNASILRAN